MATKTWASSDGNWGAAGSWSPAAVPVNNDDVVFPSDNFQDVTSGLNQSAIDLDSILIEDGCTIDIGTTGSPLQIDADLIRHDGEGTLYLQTVVATSIGQLLVSSPNWDADGAVQLVTTPATGNIGRLTVLKGKVTASGACLGTITQAEISYENNLNDALIDFSGASTSPVISILYMNGGRCFESSFTQVYLADGMVITTSAQSPTYLFQTGGVFDWKSDATLFDARILGGVFTTINDLRPKIITTLRVWPGGLADLHENVTVTSGGNLLNRPITG